MKNWLKGIQIILCFASTFMFVWFICIQVQKKTELPQIIVIQEITKGSRETAPIYFPLITFVVEDTIAPINTAAPEVTTIEPETTQPVELVEPILQPIPAYAILSENDFLILGHLVYTEGRGLKSVTEQACILWTVFNRLSQPDKFGYSIQEIVLNSGHYFCNLYSPLIDDYGRDLVQLAKDVYSRYITELETGQMDFRVLPKEYCFFWGDGRHNHFYSDYPTQRIVWDYSWESPYDS